MENEFPPNSHARREVQPSREREELSPKRELGRITTGKVVRREKSLRRKFFEAFRPEDRKGFVEYVVLEVLVDGIKANLADATSAAVDNLFGFSSSGSRYRGGGGYTSYSRMSSERQRDRRDRDRDDHRRPRREPRSDDHAEIIVESRVEANQILDILIEQISRYGHATRRDLLSMAGEPYSLTDVDWGWTDLRGARVHRVRDGYFLDLPRPQYLD